MARVKIGPALPDIKTLDVEIARLRDLDIRALQARWHTVFGSGGAPPLTCRAIFCFVFWPIGFRLIVSAIWMPRANVSSIVRDRPKMQASAQLTRTGWRRK